MSNPTGVLKKGVKPMGTFVFTNGVELSVPLSNVEYVVLSEWDNQGRAYRSYTNKD